MARVMGLVFMIVMFVSVGCASIQEGDDMDSIDSELDEMMIEEMMEE